jgi:DNA-binding MarR family transcriptional regulator
VHLVLPQTKSQRVYRYPVVVTPRPAGSRRTAPEEPHAVDDSVAAVIRSWRETRPELQVDPIAITARLARLQTVLTPRLESVFARFGLRGADFAVIATLVRLGRETVLQKRLAAELGLSAGTVSLRIDRLVRAGLAQRGPDPVDGRGAVVSLTEQGRELFEACAPEHLANAAELLAGLSEPEREQLGQLLGKLLYTLEEPGTGSVAPELGLVVDAAPVALEQRRAVGLPPLAGLLVRHVDPAGPAASSGIRPGDLLRTANRRPLRSGHDLRLALNESRGRRWMLALEITRGVEPIELWITRPATGAQTSS